MATRPMEQHLALKSLIATAGNRHHLRKLLGLKINFDLPPDFDALLTAVDEAEEEQVGQKARSRKHEH